MSGSPPFNRLLVALALPMNVNFVGEKLPKPKCPTRIGPTAGLPLHSILALMPAAAPHWVHAVSTCLQHMFTQAARRACSMLIDQNVAEQHAGRSSRLKNAWGKKAVKEVGSQSVPCRLAYLCGIPYTRRVLQQVS